MKKIGKILLSLGVSLIWLSAGISDAGDTWGMILTVLFAGIALMGTGWFLTIEKRKHKIMIWLTDQERWVHISPSSAKAISMAGMSEFTWDNVRPYLRKKG